MQRISEFLSKWGQHPNCIKDNNAKVGHNVCSLVGNSVPNLGPPQNRRALFNVAFGKSCRRETPQSSGVARGGTELVTGKASQKGSSFPQ